MWLLTWPHDNSVHWQMRQSIKAVKEPLFVFLRIALVLVKVKAALFQYVGEYFRAFNVHVILTGHYRQARIAKEALKMM